MISGQVLVDTGPLVAMLRTDDAHHASCCEAATLFPLPLITTWLVITEAAWLLRRVPSGVEKLIELLETRLVRCHDLDTDFPEWLKAFLKQYADLNPQIADASLVYVANHFDTDKVFTLDRRDFQMGNSTVGRASRACQQRYLFSPACNP